MTHMSNMIWAGQYNIINVLNIHNLCDYDIMYNWVSCK